MSPSRAAIIGTVALLAVASTTCGLTSSQPDPDASVPEPHEPSTHVAAVPIREGSLAQQATLYGAVAPLQSGTHLYALPYEARVERIHVSVGQHVAAGAPLFDSTRSPAAAISAHNATDLGKEASQRLDQVAARQADGLATREELIVAQGVLRRAEQQVAVMRRGGQLAATRTDRARRSGVVSTISAQPGGQLLPAAAVLSIAEDESIGVELWADPVDAPEIAVDMPVVLEPLSQRGAVGSPGRVTRIDDQVDAITRLVRVWVTPDEPSSLLLGQSVTGRIARRAESGLIVPRSSLVTLDGQLRVFTVDAGRAREHVVTLLVDAGDEVLIEGDLDKSRSVITRGAYQTEDGMRVEVDP